MSAVIAFKADHYIIKEWLVTPGFGFLLEPDACRRLHSVSAQAPAPSDYDSSLLRTLASSRSITQYRNDCQSYV
jgi:hypothetical protein